MMRDRRGAAIVEFAILLPALIVLMFGMLGYGQYFLLAHSTQQLANDAARATIAGVNSTERRTLAEQTVTREKASLPEAAGTTVTTDVEEAAEHVIVRVRLNAGQLSLFRTRLLPLPDAVIERRAVVRPGGVM